ncbi:carbohydrate ABC transporter permease [Lachnotalea sp. AF33-28]|uniref:carbohydrate ABC transporter permease n=1 Tax=Lachnotalea sp. AF33-28 TaxID=2292046 RepID=UPI000E4ABB48|nr:carbohydrate ABC transporter permease [Lachnotalea sp. AF33-28]RHP32361.1 carbohydrate ABC transporter permease [Lachnotalea sp. AF33-28]
MITKSRLFIALQYVFLICLIIACIVPFWLLIASSFTTERELIEHGYSLFPREANLDAYRYLMAASKGVLRAYMMSIIIAGTGVLTSITLTVLFAYPLSRQYLPGKQIISFFLFFTMLFNGGLVPTYMIYTRLFHLKDSLFAMIIPGLLMNPFNVIMMRTYITSNVANEVIEAALIDGAGEFKSLIHVVIPLSKPIIGTLALMSFIGYWNNWTNGVYYIQKRTDLYGIQNYMKNVLDSVSALQNQIANGVGVDVTDLPSMGIRMALAVVGVLPVILVYPFFQKSFVKGITIGSVKG